MDKRILFIQSLIKVHKGFSKSFYFGKYYFEESTSFQMVAIVWKHFFFHGHDLLDFSSERKGSGNEENKTVSNNAESVT